LPLGHVAPDDQVDRTVLVLERHERDAFGAARSLSRDDEARSAHV
jgi:hypothetical protein